MQCTKGGSTSEGTLHLTAHHAIFHYDEAGREELWVSPGPCCSRRRLTGLLFCVVWTRTFDLIAGAVPAHIARVADADDDAWTVSAHDPYEDV